MPQLTISTNSGEEEESLSDDSDDQDSDAGSSSTAADAADTSLEVDEYQECETSDVATHIPGSASIQQQRYSQQDSLWIMRPRSLTSLHVEEPVTVDDALASPESIQWQEAIANELQSMEQHGVWELVPRPRGANIVGCRWVFKVKTNADGSVERYKARLVAQGFRQKEGVDYQEVFAPTIGHESIRCILSLAASFDMEIHHMDIKTAFLHGELEETVYMKQPPGFARAGLQDYVCRLKRSIYGLKQSPRQWNRVIDGYLKEHGFRPSICEPCVYIRHRTGSTLPEIVTLSVDDLLLIGESPGLISGMKKMLSDRFEVTDLGDLSYFLGIKVSRDRSSRLITLSQPKYINNVLERFNMADCHPSPSLPAVPKSYLPQGRDIPVTPEAQDLLSQIPYREAVGCLMYLMVTTRPDIAYAVQAVSQHTSTPRLVHWEAVKRILRYLKGTVDAGLTLGGKGVPILKAYADADWANDPSDRKSISGYSFTLGEGAFVWKSLKQQLTASSSTEAECISLWTATKHVDHILCLLEELGCPQQGPVEIFQDNKSTIAVCEMARPKSKHIDVKHCVVREKVTTGSIKLTFTKSCDMTADVLTKGLPCPLFRAFRSALGVSVDCRDSSTR